MTSLEEPASGLIGPKRELGISYPKNIANVSTHHMAAVQMDGR